MGKSRRSLAIICHDYGPIRTNDSSLIHAEKFHHRFIIAWPMNDHSFRAARNRNAGRPAAARAGGAAQQIASACRSRPSRDFSCTLAGPAKSTAISSEIITDNQCRPLLYRNQVDNLYLTLTETESTASAAWGIHRDSCDIGLPSHGDQQMSVRSIMRLSAALVECALMSTFLGRRQQYASS